MSYASLNGVDVFSGRLVVPRSGAWHADLTIDSDDPTILQDALTLTLGAGASTWTGTLFRGDDAFGRLELTMLGGAGGLASTLPGQSYRGATARTVLTDLLTAAGETLDSTVDAGLLGSSLPAWSRMAGLASAQLNAVLAQLGAGIVWRILQNGNVWVGAETWPAAPVLDDVQLLSKDPRTGRQVLGTLTGYELLPGTAYQGLQLELVEHVISPQGLRTTIWYS